ncbi:hypothetical protein D3C83_270820 [compost metagenome]
MPISTETLESPAVFPDVTTPALVVTDPLIKAVFASGVSLNSTAVASPVPLFVMRIV